MTQYFPGMIGQNYGSGYVRVKLSHRGASFALFGRIDLASLSAVPPQIAP